MDKLKCRTCNKEIESLDTDGAWGMLCKDCALHVSQDEIAQFSHVWMPKRRLWCNKYKQLLDWWQYNRYSGIFSCQCGMVIGSAIK